MASPTQCTWAWVNSGSWQWTGRPGVLQSMGSQRVKHYWVTELNWTEPKTFVKQSKFNILSQSFRVSIQILLLFSYCFFSFFSSSHPPFFFCPPQPEYGCVLVTQSCPTLCNPLDCSSTGSSIHGFLQARILEWVALSLSGRSAQSRNQSSVSQMAGRFSPSEPPE